MGGDYTPQGFSKKAYADDPSKTRSESGQEKNMMKRKGFTLVELLVVIAIIALLMGILMPSLARVRVIANRMVCGSHLSGIGKSMMMYASDYRNKYPRAGLSNSTWCATGRIAQWDTKYCKDAFQGGATITSSFFLLVRFGDALTKQFVCAGDNDATEFQLSSVTTTIKDLTEAWDFGNDPGLHCSYSMQLPYSDIALNVQSASSSPLAADRNPYLDKNAANYISGMSRGAAPSFTDNEYSDPDLTGNAAAHERKAQNVLFNDGHVEAEAFPNCGYNYDNIWKYWNTTKPAMDEMQVGGTAPKPGVALPKSKDDACLVNDKNDYND
jgi:prepilin-type N-terminal cleavage/methylation domain-containing protein